MRLQVKLVLPLYQALLEVVKTHTIELEAKIQPYLEVRTHESFSMLFRAIKPFLKDRSFSRIIELLQRFTLALKVLQNEPQVLSCLTQEEDFLKPIGIIREVDLDYKRINLDHIANPQS